MTKVRLEMFAFRSLRSSLRSTRFYSSSNALVNAEGNIKTFDPKARFGNAQPEVPPMDYSAYMDLTKLAMVWTGSLTILGIMLSTFGYSLWWHTKREQARIVGLDLDEWAEEFAKKDPIAKMLDSFSLSQRTDISQTFNKS